MRVQHNVKLTGCGRKDIPPDKDWKSKYIHFPIERMKKGYSFNTGIDYEYGKTISIKNTCRNKARNLGINAKFAVREWNGKIRVWRTK
jgi:hypothetical protein